MKLFMFDKEDMLSKHFYMKQMLPILFILRKDLNDPEKFDDIKKLIIKEWKRDSKNEEKITREQLFNSLFELGDIWTPDVEKL